MQIHPSSITTGAAGAPIVQKDAAVQGVRNEIDAARRGAVYAQRAAAAAGVGEPDGENHETAERDADGRRPWGEPPETSADGKRTADPTDPRGAKDPSGQSGNLLDLSG